jgi:hypothetical protein
VAAPPAFPATGTWTLQYGTSQSGNVDNTHAWNDPKGPAGKVMCSDGSSVRLLGSEDFTNGSYSIVCPVSAGVMFYKWTNWGGGCCGGYTRTYILGNKSYTGC